MVIWKNNDVVKVTLALKTYYSYQQDRQFGYKTINISGFKVLIYKMKHLKVISEISSTSTVLDSYNHKEMGSCHILLTYCGNFFFFQELNVIPFSRKVLPFIIFLIFSS